MLLRNGHLVDPGQAIDGVTDIRIEGDHIAEVGPDLPVKPGEEMMDLAGLYVIPGLIDLHVHLRDPGHEDSEDLESGSRAAIAGGFTTVVAMPNTDPVIDNVPMATYIQEKSRRLGYADVIPSAAITKGEMGKEITEIGMLKEAGVPAFTDDGKTVMDAGVLRNAMDYGVPFDVLFMEHCEDPYLRDRGVMNAGQVATELGLFGAPKEAEEIIIMRDIMLAELTGARLHIQHLSTAHGLDMVRTAKAKGLPVSCEVTPHHLFLTEETVRGYNTLAKVAPPLRTAEDNAALIDGLRDGSVDCIATDHAPHAAEFKDCEFVRARFGISSMEVAFPLAWTRLVGSGQLTLSDLVRLMSARPAQLLGLERGSLIPGYLADILVFDPTTERAVDPSTFYSKGKNCPYTGEQLSGWPVHVLRAGKPILQDGKIIERSETV